MTVYDDALIINIFYILIINFLFGTPATQFVPARGCHPHRSAPRGGPRGRTASPMFDESTNTRNPPPC